MGLHPKGQEKSHTRKKKTWDFAEVPQILMGAHSSSKLGCFKKISLETAQSCRISDSDNCTCLPGRRRTSRRRLIMSSRTEGSISESPPAGGRRQRRQSQPLPRNGVREREETEKGRSDKATALEIRNVGPCRFSMRMLSF